MQAWSFGKIKTEPGYAPMPVCMHWHKPQSALAELGDDGAKAPILNVLAYPHYSRRGPGESGYTLRSRKDEWILAAVLQADMPALSGRMAGQHQHIRRSLLYFLNSCALQKGRDDVTKTSEKMGIHMQSIARRQITYKGTRAGRNSS